VTRGHFGFALGGAAEKTTLVSRLLVRVGFFVIVLCYSAVIMSYAQTPPSSTVQVINWNSEYLRVWERDGTYKGWLKASSLGTVPINVRDVDRTNRRVGIEIFRADSTAVLRYVDVASAVLSSDLQFDPPPVSVPIRDKDCRTGPCGPYGPQASADKDPTEASSESGGGGGSFGIPHGIFAQPDPGFQNAPRILVPIPDAAPDRHR
jgi:hypothetical protein